MKTYILVVLGLIALAASGWSDDKKTLAVSDIYDSEMFDGEALKKLAWVPDSNAFTYMLSSESYNNPSIYIYQVATATKSVLVDGGTFYKPGTDSLLEISSYSWAKTGDRLLIKTSTEDVWRHSTISIPYIYEVATKDINRVTEPDRRWSNAKLSPDGKLIGYVYKNNIYTCDITWQDAGDIKIRYITIQRTADGSDDIINGALDWVYEEEFSFADGWHFNSDGTKIAFYRFDLTDQKEFTLTDYNPVYQDFTKINYPKAGEPTSRVKIGIIDLATGTTSWVDHGNDFNIYIPRLKWTEDPDILSIQKMNRLQNRLDLLRVDTRTGRIDTLLAETDPCYLEIHDNLTFLKNNREFLWTSTRDGYNHIYLYSLDAGPAKQLTSGEWDVAAIAGIDEEARVVYFAASTPNIIDRGIFSVGMDNSHLTQLSKTSGWHYANFSDDGTLFVDHWSDVSLPTKSFLCSADGAVISTLMENEIPALNDYELSYPEFFTIQTDDGASLHASMIKPLDFDPSKKYPVLVNCYGGPHGRIVHNAWGGKGFLRNNILASNGYIIFSVDNRGLGGVGKEDANLVYHDLAKWAINDQIQGAKYLASLPFVDKDRIGIRGWSFGGYLTLLAMTIGADYFSVGVAGAPVTDWHLYDNIYTERYMGLPSENKSGYDSASVLSYADLLRGKLLIIHGMSDDNVHPQNSMQLIEKLQTAGREFSMMVYPGESHGVSSDDDDKADKTDVHLNELMLNFILDNL